MKCPSFMSEPYLSTRSMTCMHLKKFKVFSRLRRQGIHFRHSQCHQRAGELTGSINIFQSTTITVYEVENQKTVNIKLGKQTFWFSEVIKEFYQYFQGKKAGRHQTIENKVELHSQTDQSILKKSYGKKVKAFLKNRTEYPSN